MDSMMDTIKTYVFASLSKDCQFIDPNLVIQLFALISGFEIIYSIGYVKD